MSDQNELEKLINKANEILSINNSPGSNIIRGDNNFLVNIANLDIGTSKKEKTEEISKDLEKLKTEIEAVKNQIPDSNDLISDVGKGLRELKKIKPNWETILTLLKAIANSIKPFSHLVPWAINSLKKIFELLSPYIPNLNT